MSSEQERSPDYDTGIETREDHSRWMKQSEPIKSDGASSTPRSLPVSLLDSASNAPVAITSLTAAIGDRASSAASQSMGPGTVSHSTAPPATASGATDIARGTRVLPPGSGDTP